MRKFILLALYCLLTSMSFCQTIATSYKPLKVGDTLPDLLVTTTIHKKTATVPLRQLGKGGLLVVNFWATWCGPCVKELSLLDSIVITQKSKVDVLSIAYEKKDKVDKFLNNNRRVKTDHLYMMADDSLFIALFPHKTIPHNIWVDSNGVIRSITGYEYMREENVLKFLHNNHQAFRQKKDDTTFNMFTSLDNNGTRFLFRSLLTPFAEGRSAGNAYMPGKMFRAWNSDITGLFWTAYTSNESVIPNWSRIELQVKDSLRFVNPDKYPGLFQRSFYVQQNGPEEARLLWQEKNIFNYELALSDSVSNERMRQYVFEDLERFFGIHPRTVIKKIPCLVVTYKRTGSPLLSRAPTENYPLAMIMVKRQILVQNAKLEKLFNYMNDVFGNNVVYSNETGIDYPINMEINQTDDGPDLDYSETIKLLTSKGFHFTPALRPQPVLVLTEQSR